MIRPVAIVTGGARGIGRAIAEVLAETGFNIVVADLKTSLDNFRLDHADAYCALIEFDLANLSTHAAVIDEAMAAFGRIDCLVNNAGIASPVRGDLLALDPADFDRVLSVNLRGTVFLTQAVAKAMLAGDAAHPRSIVTITSVSAQMASPERSDYCISKAGLSMWVKTLALRLAADGIGVFEVRPGIIRSDMTAAAAARYDRLIEGGLVPAGRWGEGADVGSIVAALASGRFGFATGSILNADGALSIPRL